MIGRRRYSNYHIPLLDYWSRSGGQKINNKAGYFLLEKVLYVPPKVIYVLKTGTA